MRKTIELEISNKRAKEIFYHLTGLTGNDCAGVWFEGSLVDEFAVGMKDNQNWKINMQSGRPILARKYVYAYEKLPNCYEKHLNRRSSRLVLVLTDSEKKFKDFCESRFTEDENLNEVDWEDFCYDCGMEM